MMLQLTPRAAIRRAALTVAAAATMLAVPGTMSAANASDSLWNDTSTICVGSGADTGQAMTVTVTDSTQLNATYYGEEVYYKVWLHVYNPATRQMWWQAASDWSHYTWRANGSGSSGYVWQQNGTTLVGVGGGTAPGVWRTPVRVWAMAGLWVRPYVQAWTQRSGYALHATPIDANGVALDSVYGCKY